MPNDVKNSLLFLVRHGEAEHHTKDFTGGWTDLPLTAQGEKQIEALAVRLDKELSGRGAGIVASDLIRASQTASIIAEKLGVKVKTAGFLREKNNGRAAGRTSAAAAALKLPRQAAEPDNRNYPGGETRREFYERVANGMEGLELSGKPLIIVSHKGTIQNILFWWLGLSIDDVCRLGVSFAAGAGSLSVLKVNKWREHEISLLNDCGHLPSIDC